MMSMFLQNILYICSVRLWSQIVYGIGKKRKHCAANIFNHYLDLSLLFCEILLVLSLWTYNNYSTKTSLEVKRRVFGVTTHTV